MSKKLAIVILNFTIIFLIGTFSAFGQQKEVDLKDQRITIKMDKQHLALVFRYLMENYDIPIGFEQSTLDKNHTDYDFETNSPSVGIKRLEGVDENIKAEIEAETVFEVKKHSITVNAENKKLEDVLNIIVRQMENYKWEINDGVVDIFPIQGRDERFEKLLGTNIDNFTFEKGKTIGAITTNIMKLPEFTRFLSENNLFFTGVRSGVRFTLMAQYGRKLDVEMNFSNLSFRELLNKVTKIKRGGWVLKIKKLSRAGEEHIDIDI